MPTTHTLMSQESFEKYGGSCCPVCHSSHVEAEPGTLTADGDVAWDEVTCNDCASTWRELFQCSEYTQLVVSDRLKDQPCAHCGRSLSEHDRAGHCPTADDDEEHEDLYVLVNLAHPTGEAHVMAEGDECVAYPSVDAAAIAQQRILTEHDGHTLETARLFKLTAMPLHEIQAAQHRIANRQENEP